jgi:hypothetical protein
MNSFGNFFKNVGSQIYMGLKKRGIEFKVNASASIRVGQEPKIDNPKDVICPIFFYPEIEKKDNK